MFFHHWAKPLFVLLASPFAQFGFTGIKIFNVINVILTLIFTYKTAQVLHFKNAAIVVLILIFIPVYYILTFSGLTEPLFAMLLISGIYFAARKNFIIACIIISFTPFVRTEAYLFLFTFAVFLAVNKKWKYIPFLITGNIIYSISGYFVYHDLLWAFTKIPYVASSNKYGQGDMFHFVNQLYYITGVPLFILFWIGIIDMIYNVIRKKIKSLELILILFSFAGFFIAHSMFWYLGIFDSMGLSRVLICVIPLIALIMLQGYNLIFDKIFIKKTGIKTIIQVCVILYIIVFPFTSNPAAIDFKNDLNLSKDQELAKTTINFIMNNNLAGNKFYYSHPYLSEILNIDHFDTNKREDLRKHNLKKLKPNDIIIWENWFAVVECGITEEYLLKTGNMEKIKSFSISDNGRKIIYSIFKQKK